MNKDRPNLDTEQLEIDITSQLTFLQTCRIGWWSWFDKVKLEYFLDLIEYSSINVKKAYHLAKHWNGFRQDRY